MADFSGAVTKKVSIVRIIVKTIAVSSVDINSPPEDFSLILQREQPGIARQKPTKYDKEKRPEVRA
jgi:hypothetical protein